MGSDHLLDLKIMSLKPVSGLAHSMPSLFSMISEPTAEESWQNNSKLKYFLGLTTSLRMFDPPKY